MGRGSALKIRVQTVGEAVLVSPSGTLELTTAPQLRTFLARRLADQPGAVIVLLQDLVLAKSHSLSVFTTLARQVADWSGVPLLLVTGRNRSRELQRHSELISRFIPVHPDLASALAAMHNPPARQLSRLRLAPEPHSAATARRFVASVCELWHCEEVAEDAVAIVSELVANVVRHAKTDADLRLELRRQRLTVSVADGSPLLPVRRPPGVRENGLGLGIVTALSSAWGASPTSSGGKVIWATIGLRSPNARVAINNSWRNGL
ncbi:ATP-binding protein [Kribbella sp. CA-293567]|uniref:ATP-binding protein n=1 Tax=Kribbella sp. CA-293567 TaxID=3002436 RepID=UPI0022DDCC66|nr:ATP-binding protein [Kribbella sp. CA-293567]WBQ04826.1 ATP-binding protein [Kribbella sp. CA-293567]